MFDAKATDSELTHADEARFSAICRVGDGYGNCRKFEPSLGSEAVKKIQAGYKAQSLSSFLNQPPPAPAPALSFPKFEKDLVRTEFFEYLEFALQFAPALPEDRWIREQLARIGVGPGKSFDFRSLSLEDKAEILLGMKEGEHKVTEAVASLGKDINGWRVGAPFGDAAFYYGDWLMRAAAAKAGIYGNDAVEAMYPLGKVDTDGKELDCSKSNYTLTFPAGSSRRSTPSGRSRCMTARRSFW